MNKVFFCFIFFLILNLLSSCLITTEPYRKTRIFDIGPIQPSEIYLNVENVENPNMYKHYFVYRLDRNELTKDAFNRWIALPENMIRSGLKTAFRQEPGSPVLSVKILKFEFDKSRQMACLSLSYSIRRSDGSFVITDCFDGEKRIDDFSPELFASAMTDLFEQFINKIKQYNLGVNKDEIVENNS